MFLFRALGFIFAVQAFAIVFSFHKCVKLSEERAAVPSEVCPQLGDRFESATNLMIATVLSLLVGNQIKEGE